MSNTTPYANSVFEQPWWLDLVAPGKWAEATVKDGDTVLARLPYVMDGGVVMPDYTQTLGVWMADGVRAFSRGNDQCSKQKELLEALLAQLPKKKSVDIVLHCSQEYILPFRWFGYQIEPTFSYRIEDLSDLAAVEQNFSKSVKRDINRGKKTLTVDCADGGTEELIELQNETYRRQKRKNPIDNAFTRAVMEGALAAGHGRVMIARDENGAPHAGCFVVYDENACYHLLSGQNTAFGNDGAMPLLFSAEIAFAAKVSRVFDFEGSMVEGIEQVFRRYGGRQVINWHVSKQSLVGELKQAMKPRIKRMIGYKI